MKNLILFFLVLSFAANGQETETQSRFLLGGTLSYSNTTFIAPETEFDPSNPSAFIFQRQESITHNAAIAPYFGFRLNDQSFAGLVLNLGYQSSVTRIDNEEDPVFKNESFIYGGGLFYRFYINPANRFKVFAQPFVNYQITETDIVNFNPAFEEQRRVSFNAGASLGAVYSVSEKWNLLVNIWSISFARSNFKQASEPDEQITNTFNANFSIQNIGFGAEYNF